MTIWNVYDAAGRLLEVRRAPEGTTRDEASFTTIEKNTYNPAGELVSKQVPGANTTGALVETTYVREELDGGGEKTTTTYPNGGTRIEITAADGKLLEVHGSATHAMRYEYGVDQGMAFTKTIYLKESPQGSGNYVETDEWTAVSLGSVLAS